MIVPEKLPDPVGRYLLLSWGGGFESWPLYRISTIGDGSCLFHALANAFILPYRTEKLNSKKISRKEIVTNLRHNLASRLKDQVPGSPDGRRYYDELHNGYTGLFSQIVPEFRLDYMMTQLNSSAYIGYGYMEYIGNVLNKDIYILDALHQGLYRTITDEYQYTIKGNRNSVVIYWNGGHYELIGLKDNQGKMVTHFSPDHSFIEFLYALTRSFISK
jgi:hypothetical protein